jgi:hypothetical protein
MIMSFRGKSRLILLCTALVVASACSAQARDFEMGGDGNYNIMAPEPGTASHHVVSNRHGRTVQRSSRSTTAAQQAATGGGAITDTPEQIATFKRNRRAYVGSSGLVLPTPPAGPTHYAPIGTPPAPLHSVQEQGPTILPGTGRAIPNLPHGPETFQDRASRCAFQSSINNIPGGQMSSYMHNCAM